MLATHAIMGASRSSRIIILSSPPGSTSHDFSLTCPACHANVTVTTSFSGRPITCPVCGTSLRIPESTPPLATDEDEILDALPADELDDSYRSAFFGEDAKSPTTASEPIAVANTDAPESTGSADEEFEYRTRPEDDVRPVTKVEVFRAPPPVKRQKRPKPPKHLYFSNVFQFPWSSTEMLVRWCYLSLGLAAMCLLLAFGVWVIQTAGAVGSVVMGFVGMGTVWVGLFAFSYGASLSLAIITETSAGSDEVTTCNDTNLRDWLFELIQTFWLFIFAGFLAMLITGPFLPLTETLSPQIFVVQFVLFPAVILSALDAESIWIPFSLPVFVSYRHVFKRWMQFYGLTFAVILLAFVLIGVSGYFSPWISGVIGGPILAAAMLIYARLLGRLGYAITIDLERRAKPSEESSSAKPLRNPKPTS